MTVNRKRRPDNQRKQLFLARSDFEAIDHIKDKLGLASRTAAVRHALATAHADLSSTPTEREQALRDDVAGSHSRGIRLGRAETNNRSWCVCLDLDDRTRLRAVQTACQLKSMNQVIKLAVRVEAERSGFRPAGGVY